MSAAVTSAIGRHGSTYTIRKASQAAGANDWTAGTSTVTFHACRARERGYKPAELRGGIQERDALLVIDPASLPAGVVPAEGDRVALGTFTVDDATADWRQVVNAYSPRTGATVGAYRLQVRR